MKPTLSPSATPPPAKSRRSKPRLFLNAIFLQFFVWAWLFFLVGLARRDPDTLQTGRYLLVIVAVEVAVLLAVQALS